MTPLSKIFSWTASGKFIAEGDLDSSKPLQEPDDFIWLGEIFVAQDLKMQEGRRDVIGKSRRTRKIKQIHEKRHSIVCMISPLRMF
jgi:hypothetical protein